MPDTDYLYALTVEPDGELRLALGHAFDEQDIAELIAAQRAVLSAVGTPAAEPGPCCRRCDESVRPSRLVPGRLVGRVTGDQRCPSGDHHVVRP